ncbi:6095_t:CDS:2 [Dentiscutata heterogama]|uniref:6095_t:CDS:1 n=1 Tax=Dentiscutata heterogama TaxID=1316150 RepID=A0ACA9LXJ8_9GLOM|nr:6095_t:CDS:2 [Dentiscutata heterogama]
MDGNKNRPVIVIHHIQGEKPMFKNQVKIKLGWIIFGPPKSFNFSIQYPLVFKSRKYQPFREKDHPIISKFGMFGTCVLEATDITPHVENSPQVEIGFNVENSPQVENNSDMEIVTYDQIKYDPKSSPFAIGNYLTRCQEPVHQESAYFVYDIKAKKKVTDENVLKRLSLYSCSKEIKTSNKNLTLVNQIFDHYDCKDCQPLGFVNIISDKIFYGSLNSENLNIVKSDGSIVYLSIPLKSIAERQ